MNLKGAFCFSMEAWERHTERERDRENKARERWESRHTCAMMCSVRSKEKPCESFGNFWG